MKAQLTTVPKGEYRSKDFAFRGMIICAKCRRKITATEKVKILKNGLAAHYIYYHCSKDPADPCLASYIREEKLVVQLVALLDSLTLNKRKLRARFADDFAKFTAFSRGVLGHSETGEVNLGDAEYRNYLRYVLQNGTLEERKTAMSMIDTPLMLDNKILKIQ